MTDSESSEGAGFPPGGMSWVAVIVASHCGLNEYHWAIYFKTGEMVLGDSALWLNKECVLYWPSHMVTLCHKQ